MKWVKCSKFLKNSFDAKLLAEITDKFHTDENYSGINETFSKLKHERPKHVQHVRI